MFTGLIEEVGEIKNIKEIPGGKKLFILIPPFADKKILFPLMDTSKHLRSFIEIGLTEREAKVYMTLLNGKMFTVLELQEAANIPRTKIYEVLNKLINRNICIEKKLGKNKLYEAVEPKLAMERIFKNYKKRHDRFMEYFSKS